jgi:hypothetical protein
MEGPEQRKSLRLTLPGALLVMASGQVKVNNISLEGINLLGRYPLNSTVQGTLTLEGQVVGELTVLIVNHQAQTSGGVIVNAAQVASQLQTWFDPKTLITNLVPSAITENLLSYEDFTHHCRFNFAFNATKKIDKVEILIYESRVSWTATGWQTGQGQNWDRQPDGQKIKLAQTLINESAVFPQSFKDWLLALK